MQWVLKHFDELSTNELYTILEARSAVFVVEQNCPYNDLDNKDIKCHHLMAYNIDNQLLAYTRILPIDVSYNAFCSIGRVLTTTNARSLGIGKQLMEKSIEYCKTLYPQAPIKIGAQLYLKKFYESFGFVTTSDVYLEDNIEHIEMELVY